MMQFILAIDQLVNTLVYSSDDKSFGCADETLSARCWRLRNKSTFWRRGRIFVDLLFFFQKEHCFNAYKSEVLLRQLPSTYYANALMVYQQEREKLSGDEIEAFIRYIS